MSSAIQDVTHSSDSGQEGHSQGHRRRASKKRHSPGSQVQDSEAEAEEELEPERTQRYHAKQKRMLEQVAEKLQRPQLPDKEDAERFVRKYISYCTRGNNEFFIYGHDGTQLSFAPGKPVRSLVGAANWVYEKVAANVAVPEAQEARNEAPNQQAPAGLETPRQVRLRSKEAASFGAPPELMANTGQKRARSSGEGGERQGIDALLQLRDPRRQQGASSQGEGRAQERRQEETAPQAPANGSSPAPLLPSADASAPQSGVAAEAARGLLQEGLEAATCKLAEEHRELLKWTKMVILEKRLQVDAINKSILQDQKRVDIYEDIVRLHGEAEAMCKDT